MTMLLRMAMAAVLICGMGLVAPATALDTSSIEFLGTYVPPEPSSVADEIIFINTLIAQPLGGTTQVNLGNPQDPYTFVRSSNLCGGSACDPVTTGSQGPSDPASGDVDVTGFSYLIGKYDGPNGGGVVWFVGDLSGVQTIPTNLFGFGLSHWALFDGTTTVPEPGTLLLVGTGLVALGFWRRKR